MKLYKVTIRGGHGATGTNHNECFVVSEDSSKAYKQYRAFLDKKDLCFRDEREMEKIELIADTDQYGECRTLLFLPESEAKK